MFGVYNNVYNANTEIILRNDPAIRLKLCKYKPK